MSIAALVLLGLLATSSSSSPDVDEAAASPEASPDDGAETSAAAAPQEGAFWGFDFAGLPLLNFTTDRGTGYGAYLATFFRPQDGAAPYEWSLGGQYYATTGGYAFHKLVFDMPNIAKTGIRLELTGGYENWDTAPYFGIGAHTPRLRPELTPQHFYDARITSLWVIANARFPLYGPWKLFLGPTFRHADVAIYPGSRLDLDRPVGGEGGPLTLVNAGILVDTRDKEPSPTVGVFSEATVRFAHPWIGSRFAYAGANVTHRQFFPLLHDDRLVLALRLTVDVQDGDVPFFQQAMLGGSQWVEVGGNNALRGLAGGRLRGNFTALGSLELRTKLAAWEPFGQRVGLTAVPFADAGQVWAWHQDEYDPAYRVSVGAGLRVSYNEVFVVRVDVAFAGEEYGSALAKRGTTTTGRGIEPGVYAIVGQPF